VAALCCIVLLSWVHGMEILSLHSFLLFLFILIFLSTLSEPFPSLSSSSSSSSSDEVPPNERTQRQKMIFLEHLIEKNKTFHKKYKIKNSVIAYVSEYWQLDATVGEEISKFIHLIVKDFIDPWYRYGE
jgi:hypothetical protein